VTLSQARAHLCQLLARTAAGEEFDITRHGRPMVRLTPIVPAPLVSSRPGGGEDFRVSEDFDAPLPDEALASFLGGIDRA
jgi:prevent-host-death family protein